MKTLKKNVNESDLDLIEQNQKVQQTNVQGVLTILHARCTWRNPVADISVKQGSIIKDCCILEEEKEG